jgi:hypothetical protein
MTEQIAQSHAERQRPGEGAILELFRWQIRRSH